MFQGCNQLKTITFPNNFDSAVTNMDKMFYECSSLTNINFSLLKTSNVNSMNYSNFNQSSIILKYINFPKKIKYEFFY